MDTTTFLFQSYYLGLFLPACSLVLQTILSIKFQLIFLPTIKKVKLRFLDIRYIWDNLQEVTFHIWMASKYVTPNDVGVVAIAEV